MAQASGISVGAFYLFFASKEALLFALLEEEEQTLKQELLSGPWLEPPLTRNKLSGLLQHAFDLATKNPIIRQAVEMDVYQQMASSVSPEAMEQHAAQDQLDLRPLLEWAKAQGRLQDIDEEVVSGALRSLFLLNLHEDIIGKEIFPQVVTFWIDAMATAIIKDEE